MSITFFTKFPRPESLNSEYYSTYIKSNVIISANAGSVYYPEHHGGPLSIKYVFKGEEYYICNNAKYRVKNDRFLIFNELQQYESYIDGDKETESFSVFFKPDYVREVLGELITPKDRILENPVNTAKRQGISFIQKLYPKDNVIVPIILKLRNGLKSGVYSEDFYYEQLFFLLKAIVHTNRRLYSDIEKVAHVRKSTKTEIYRRINIAKDFIASCYNEDITVSLISKAACMSKYHLLREFKKYYGITPYQYLTETRLNTAKNLLAGTSKTISEISGETGFEYSSSFSQLFYQRFGITPTVFRKKSCA
jgi:AraC family transcriptional regulator